jgi:hypothetical protein
LIGCCPLRNMSGFIQPKHSQLLGPWGCLGILSRAFCHGTSSCYTACVWFLLPHTGASYG